MKLAIMQPYFLPYIGYYQLVSAVDAFIVYDNIKYTKKGWINRNRILLNGKDVHLTIPLKRGSDALEIFHRELAADFDRMKLIRKLIGLYKFASHFNSNFPLIKKIVEYEDNNLFNYLFNSLEESCKILHIKTPIIKSSTVKIDHGLMSQEKVIAICNALGADTYINLIGGVNLYDKAKFASHGINLQFLKANRFEYEQFGLPFVPWLSILDMLMFNCLNSVKVAIFNNYDLF
jgi:hypothetical protein